jgi:hypothetical protein
MNNGINAFYVQARKKYWVPWLRTFDDITPTRGIGGASSIADVREIVRELNWQQKTSR